MPLRDVLCWEGSRSETSAMVGPSMIDPDGVRLNPPKVIVLNFVIFFGVQAVLFLFFAWLLW